jgi:tetraacyldisaccharide 4'-kinase
MVVTTEKDAVRIPTDFNPAVPFYYLRLEIEILSGAQDFQEAVARICFPKEELRIRGGLPRTP